MSSFDENLLKLLHEAGLSNRQIAKRLEIHHRTVADYLRKLNLTSNFYSTSIRVDKVVGQKTSKCTKCNKRKKISEFPIGRRGEKYEYRYTFCWKCRKRMIYTNLNNDIEKFLTDRYRRLVVRGGKLNIKVTISKEDFIAQYHSQSGKCFYTDIKMKWGVDKGKHRNSVSVDKIIPTKGYVKGNVVFCCTRINTVKHDLSLKEMQLWMPKFYNRVRLFLDKNKK